MFNHTCTDQGCFPGVVCRCLQITEAELANALATQPICSLKDLRQQTGAGDACTACHFLLQKILEEKNPALQPASRCG